VEAFEIPAEGVEGSRRADGDNPENVVQQQVGDQQEDVAQQQDVVLVVEVVLPLLVAA